MYCQSFRQEGIYYEAVTNRLRDDMVACMQPRWLQIVTMGRGEEGSNPPWLPNLVMSLNVGSGREHAVWRPNPQSG